MATGTGNLPNDNMSFSPFAILTAEEMNDLVENIESLAEGTGIGDGSVDTAALADEAVTASKIDFSTLGWTTYTPTIVGFSVEPPGAVYRYLKIGTLCILQFSQPTNGTSNSTSFTISLPVQASNSGVGQWNEPLLQTINNGTTEVGEPGIISISANGTVATLYRNIDAAPWTNSGGKRVPSGTITYECIP